MNPCRCSYLEKFIKDEGKKLKRVSLYLEKFLRDWRESEKGEPYTWKICKWPGGQKKGEFYTWKIFKWPGGTHDDTYI